MTLQTIRPWAYRGAEVRGPEGRRIGTVREVWPLDGGGEPELVLVEVGTRFCRRRFLPLDARSRLDGGVLHVPWTRWQIGDAPDAEDRRWGHPADVARSYWRDAAD